MLGQFASSPLGAASGMLQQAASVFSAALGPVSQVMPGTVPPTQLAAPTTPGLGLAPLAPTAPLAPATPLAPTAPLAPGVPMTPGLTTPVPGQAAIPGAINGLLGSIPMPNAGTPTAPAPATALAAPNPLQSLMNPFTALP